MKHWGKNYYKPEILYRGIRWSGDKPNGVSTDCDAVASEQFLGKINAKIPVDWENDNAIPVTAEVQLGKIFSSSFGVYMDGLIGIGSDRPYDWGFEVGGRFNY